MTEPDAPFDPYRYGRPDHPVPPEFAPPGYVPDSPPANPYPPTGPNAYQQLPPPYPGVPYPGSPAPTAYQGYEQPRTGTGKAVTALVTGILSILGCWLSLFDVIFVALAVVFGILALNEAKRGGRGRGMAIGGLVCALVGAVLATVLTIKIIDVADKCGGLSHPGVSNTDFRQCVTNKL